MSNHFESSRGKVGGLSTFLLSRVGCLRVAVRYSINFHISHFFTAIYQLTAGVVFFWIATVAMAAHFIIREGLSIHPRGFVLSRKNVENRLCPPNCLAPPPGGLGILRPGAMRNNLGADLLQEKGQTPDLPPQPTYK